MLTEITMNMWHPARVCSFQRCFMFKVAATQQQTVNVEQYAEAVTGNKHKCIENVCVIKPETLADQ